MSVQTGKSDRLVSPNDLYVKNTFYSSESCAFSQVSDVAHGPLIILSCKIVDSNCLRNSVDRN